MKSISCQQYDVAWHIPLELPVTMAILCYWPSCFNHSSLSIS
jgi:hypothetical protein